MALLAFVGPAVVPEAPVAILAVVGPVPAISLVTRQQAQVAGARRTLDGVLAPVGVGHEEPNNGQSLLPSVAPQS